MRASRRHRFILVFLLALSFFNYFLHILGFTIFPQTFSMAVLPKGTISEIQRMQDSPLYYKYAYIHASFMVGIVVQFFFAILLVVLLLFRRALIRTKIIPYQEVEQLKWLSCIVLTCIISLPFWYFEGATTFFNENNKIGGRPFWVGALFINIPMFFSTPILSAFWLCPEAINYNLNSRNLQK